MYIVDQQVDGHLESYTTLSTSKRCSQADAVIVVAVLGFSIVAAAAVVDLFILESTGDVGEEKDCCCCCCWWW